VAALAALNYLIVGLVICICYLIVCLNRDQRRLSGRSLRPHGYDCTELGVGRVDRKSCMAGPRQAVASLTVVGPKAGGTALSVTPKWHYISALPQAVKVIGPGLHHLPTLLEPLSPVVDRPYAALLMGKLQLDDVGRIAAVAMQSPKQLRHLARVRDRCPICNGHGGARPVAIA
jgi:hypothetical protein